MISEPASLYKLHTKDLVQACAVLADAFHNDPIWNAMRVRLPKIQDKLNALYELPLRLCLRYGEVYATSDQLEGIAGWVPGAHADMTLWRLVRSGALFAGLKIGPRLALKMQPALVSLDRDRNRHMQDTPFIYLHIIGVATIHQGKGYGRLLLQALIEKSEKVGLPIYLETETARNAEMYQRFGFNIVKEIILPIINLPMWEMIRKPIQ